MLTISQAVKLPTEDQLKVVDKKITDNGSNLTKKGLNFKGDDATSIHKDLGRKH